MSDNSWVTTALVAAISLFAGLVVLLAPAWEPPTQLYLFHGVFLLGFPALVLSGAMVLRRSNAPAVVGQYSFGGYLSTITLAAAITSSYLTVAPSGVYSTHPWNEAEVVLRNANVGGFFGLAAGASYGQLAHTRRIQRELKRRNEQLEAFAGIVAHDLRNPLNVASGWLDLASQECESEHLDEIEKAHGRMESLIEDLLALARAGEQLGDLESVTLATVLREAWETVEANGTSLVVDADVPVRADRSRLIQLFENVFRNAVDHTEGETTVTVGALTDGFYIEDNGPGIPEERRDEVFEAGYSTAEDGTGLGLMIVKEIVDAHGWEITVTEGEAGGARLEITGVTVDGR